MRDPNYRVLLTTLVALVFSGALWAQDSPPPPTQRGPELGLPIDQHLHYLIVAGLAFGLYWAYKQIKSQRSRD